MTKLIPLPDPPTGGPGAAKFTYDHRDDLVPLKRLIWLYFVLLILEGALRKWVLPSLANPLLIIRDPLVILIYIVAFSLDAFPKNGFIAWILGLAVVGGLASEMSGRGNLLITLYGLRTDFLHLPLIFLLPAVFPARDIHRFGKWLLIIAIPMAFLVVAQFRASPESKLNVGAGGSIGGQMEVAMGKIRPAGTFSFNTGMVDFIAVVAAYLIGVQMATNSPNRKWAMAALPALFMMVAVSGSRSSLGMVVIILLGVVFVCIKKPAFFGKGMKGIVALGIAYFALSFWAEFRTGLMVHESRLETGGGIQHGMLYRIFSEMLSPFHIIGQTPLFGKGLGMGTNVAAGLLFGERGFLLAESEWERVVLESGPLLGFTYIAFRLVIVVYLCRHALAALNRDNPLPMLLFCAAAPGLINGQFAVPTTLGFSVLNAGLCLVSCGLMREADLPLEVVPPIEPPKRTVRGRSVYAEQLHGG